MKLLFFVGCLVFGGFFLYNGIHHLQKRDELAEYAGTKRVPQPEVAVSVTGVMLILGGLNILLGLKPKLGAAMIAGFLVGVSPLIHDFWRMDPNQRLNELAHFSKNLALLGATLALAAVPEPWPASAPVARPKARRREFEEIEAA